MLGYLLARIRVSPQARRQSPTPCSLPLARQRALRSIRPQASALELPIRIHPTTLRLRPTWLHSGLRQISWSPTQRHLFPWRLEATPPTRSPLPTRALPPPAALPSPKSLPLIQTSGRSLLRRDGPAELPRLWAGRARSPVTLRVLLR